MSGDQMKTNAVATMPILNRKVDSRRISLRNGFNPVSSTPLKRPVGGITALSANRINQPNAYSMRKKNRCEEATKNSRPSVGLEGNGAKGEVRANFPMGCQQAPTPGVTLGVAYVQIVE